MNDLADDDELKLLVESDPLIGQTLAGCYRIESIIGRGGMGVVYQAQHKELDRAVAVKTFNLSRVSEPEVIRRFQQEAKAVCKVRHQHTVNLYDFGVSEEGQPFLVMELLQGVTFRQILKKDGPLTLARFNAIIQQVVDALSCAHEAGIVHKDLKPENIMLCHQADNPEWVYVLDFGIASMVEPSNAFIGNQNNRRELIGSPPYMSPEQCLMELDIDHRSDIYSLAIMVFEALSGQFPFRARTAREVIDCHMSVAPLLLKEMGPNFSTYESVTQVLNKAFEKKKEKRYQSIREFGQELDQAVSRDSIRGVALKHRLGSEPPTNNGADPSGKAADGKSSGKYQVFICPHCEAASPENLSLCLSCGRSLVTTNDFSKIRVAKGDFNLPKYQGTNQSPNKGFSKRSRDAMANSGRVWTRPFGLIIVTIVLLVCVFFGADGLKILNDLFNTVTAQKLN